MWILAGALGGKVSVMGKRGPLPRIYHSAEAMISARSTADPKCLALSYGFI